MPLHAKTQAVKRLVLTIPPRAALQKLRAAANRLCIVLATLIYCSGAALAADKTLAWDAPTTRTDGSPLTDLRDYKLYLGTSSRNYTSFFSSITTTNYQIRNLEAGTYYAAVTAFSSDGSESGFSNEVVFSVIGAIATPTRTATRTPTRTPTSLISPPVNTTTPTGTRIPQATFTRTPTRTATRTPSSSATKTPTRTPTGTATRAGTAVSTPTITPTPLPTTRPVTTGTPSATPTHLPLEASIEGEVLDTDLRPIRNVMIYSPQLSSARTDKRGRFILDRALAGKSYEVRPSKTGYLFEPETQEALAGGKSLIFVGEAAAMPTGCKTADMTAQLLAMDQSALNLAELAIGIKKRAKSARDITTMSSGPAKSLYLKVKSAVSAMPETVLRCEPSVLECSQVSLVKGAARLKSLVKKLHARALQSPAQFEETSRRESAAIRRRVKKADGLTKKFFSAIERYPAYTYECE